MKKKDKTAALSREFQNLLDDMENLLEEAASLTGEEFQEAKENIENRMTSTKKMVVDLGEGIGDRTRKTSAKVNQEVHDEPWKAVGVGAAAGILLGMLFSRR